MERLRGNLRRLFFTVPFSAAPRRFPDLAPKARRGLDFDNPDQGHTSGESARCFWKTLREIAERSGLARRPNNERLKSTTAFGLPSRLVSTPALTFAPTIHPFAPRCKRNFEKVVIVSDFPTVQPWPSQCQGGFGCALSIGSDRARHGEPLALVHQLFELA